VEQKSRNAGDGQNPAPVDVVANAFKYRISELVTGVGCRIPSTAADRDKGIGYINYKQLRFTSVVSGLKPVSKAMSPPSQLDLCFNSRPGTQLPNDVVELVSITVGSKSNPHMNDWESMFDLRKREWHFSLERMLKE